MRNYLLKALLWWCAILVCGNVWADTVTFTPSDFAGQGTYGDGSAMSATKNGVTLACDYGYGTTDIRCYSGSTVTISSSNTITALSFTFAGDYDGGLKASYKVSTTSWSKWLVSQARLTEVTVTYTVTEDVPTHKATFYVNGGTYDEKDVEEGAAINFPANPSALGGKSFVGWAMSAIVGTTDDEPSMLTSANMEDADVSFYAVYATLFPGDEVTKDDNLTAATIEVYSYADWSGKKWSSDAVYAGNSAIDYSCIQLRPNNSSGIVSTTSGGTLNKVAIGWLDSTPPGRTIQVYGKNTAYSSAANLYNNSNKGTLLGTIVKGTNTELTIDGDYAYVGICASGYSMYLNSITITWASGTPDTYSGYCTTITVTTPAVTSVGWATYVTEYDMEFADNEAYVVTAAGDNVTLQSVTKVRAGVPVLLKGVGAKTATALNEAPAAIANKLAVSTGGAVTGYVLSKKNEVVGFYKWLGGTLDAGKVYLPASEVASAREFIGFDEATGIKEARGKKQEKRSKWYDLQGRSVGQSTKGVYIVNGKKVVIAK